MIWPMTKTPRRTGSSENPASSSVQPNVSRNCPSDGLSPGSAKARPSAPAISPFTIEPWLMAAMSISAITTIAKYSNGPNVVAQRDSGTDSTTMKMPATRPPTSDAPIERPRARSASPRSAIGYPSNVVITEDGVPGILRRVALMRPPETEPTYIATISTRACVEFM